MPQCHAVGRIVFVNGNVSQCMRECFHGGIFSSFTLVRGNSGEGGSVHRLASVSVVSLSTHRSSWQAGILARIDGSTAWPLYL